MSRNLKMASPVNYLILKSAEVYNRCQEMWLEDMLRKIYPICLEAEQLREH